MSASDNQGPDDRKERYRRAIAFLQRARALSELTPSQIERIEGRLQHPARPRARRAVLSPALAVLAIVLLAGAALATAGRSLTRVPLVGTLVQRLWGPAPGDRGGGHARGNPANELADVPPSALAPVPAPPVPLPDPRPATTIDDRPPALVGPATNSAARAGSEEGAAPAPVRDQRPRPETRIARAAHPGGFDVTRSDAVAPPAATATPAGAVARRPDRDDDARGTPPPAKVAPSLAPGPPAVDPSQPASQPLAARPPPAPTAPLAAPSAAPAATSRAPAAVESAIVAESRSFASALALWHRDHDAPAALAALDAHERRFPSGEIRLEAQLLRAEILLAGGRAREGLALLDRLALTGLPRARELLTVRGELRVKLGRCADGRSDLQSVLAGGEADPLGQRARRALAGCP